MPDPAPIISNEVRAAIVDSISRRVADCLTCEITAREATSAEAEIICGVLLGVLQGAQKHARRNRLELAYREAVVRTGLTRTPMAQLWEMAPL